MTKLSYENTSVPVERSKQAIRDLLIRFGARGAQFGEDFSTGTINIKFAKEVSGNLRTVSVTLQIPEPPKVKRQRQGTWRGGRFIPSHSNEQRREQMARVTYRALHYWLKSQFEAVQFGMFSFESVFLSHFEWMIEGRRTTVGEIVLPHLGGGENFLPAPRTETDDVIDADYK